MLGFLIFGGMVLLILFLIWAAKYTKVGPNEVLIISGRKRTIIDETGKKKTIGYRIVGGGGTFVWPIKEKVSRLSLELMDLEVKTPEVYTVHGVPVAVDGVAQIKIKGDDTSIAIASEQFLSRPREEIIRTALQVTEGYMRAILGKKTIEDIYTKRSEFASEVKLAASSDLSKMGLEIVSLTVRNISDPRGYLEALGRPRIAQVKRDAIIGEAKADEEAKTYRYKADTAIEEARKNHEIKVQEFSTEIAKSKAESDLAYDLQKFKTAQLVKKEEIQVGIVEKELQTQLQEKEILRKEKELISEVTKPAEAEKEKIKLLAEAEKYRLETVADGEASKIKEKGFAEAEVIKAQGLSEAEAMRKKAESWQQYNRAAITEQILRILPELAKAISEPLSKTEKIVMVSSGDGVGVSKLTGDVAKVVSQLPPVVEALTGIKLEELVKKIPAFEEKKE
ncbi:MAG: SPFH domain-containing protein [Candidatus Omnitrophica bacterium]|nr:SPFH domain-containing protein [Candidatus Omnitrophota bacterium]